MNKVEVIPGISDHDCPLVEVDVSPIRQRQKPREILLYKKAQWDTMAEELEEVSQEIRNEAETSTVSHITPEIAKMIKRRDRLYKKKKKHQRNFEYSTASYQSTDKRLRELKGEIQKQMRRAYWAYIEEIITPMDEMDEDSNEKFEGMKRFWTFIKSVRKDYSGVAALKVDGKTTADAKEKADALNRQFESVFTHEDPISPQLLQDQSRFPAMPEIEITVPGVQKMLERLKVHKACGPDAISPRMLKELAPVIAPMLTVIYQKSYDTGELPDDWKKANVVAIYKKGKNSDPSNYRPISLTCVSCKIMEHIVASSIMKHAKRHNILYDLQHGFRDKRSCETQFVGFITDVANNMMNGKQTDVLIMDFSKAFDKVGHHCLVEKMKHYGVQGKTNTWIRAFLSNRKQ